MAALDIIKYEGDNSTFVWKHPREDFNTMSQLIVHESQEAVFFMNGQALDLFGPGRHTLETQNIPLLSKIIKIPTGGATPFHCEVYFINKTVQTSLKWGTPSKIRFIEPTYNVPVEIGASGVSNISVCDSRKLLVKLVGTTSGIAFETKKEDEKSFTKSIKDVFLPLITTTLKAHLPTAIKSANINIVEIDEHLETLSESLRIKLIPGFEEYGLTIPQFYITEVLLPEKNEAFDKLRRLYTLSVRKATAEMNAELVEASRKATIEQQITETEVAKREAERELIKAQTEAQAAKISGFAEAEIMRAKGYDQKDVFNTEVQKAYAEGIGNMTINGGGGVAGDMIGLGVGMAAAGAVAPQLGEMFKGFTPQTASDEKAAQKTVCPNCNNEIPANAKFCLECGEKIAPAVSEGMVVCPECGKTVAKGKFCLECGYKFITACPKCGKEIVPGAKFCLECGEKL